MSDVQLCVNNPALKPLPVTRDSYNTRGLGVGVGRVTWVEVCLKEAHRRLSGWECHSPGSSCEETGAFAQDSE